MGVAIFVLSGFFPTTLTSTFWVGLVALIPTVEPPANEMLLKLYWVAGLLATKTMLVCDPKVTLGSDNVVPTPLIVMVLPLSKQLVPRVKPSKPQAPEALLMGPTAGMGEGAGICGVG